MIDDRPQSVFKHLKSFRTGDRGRGGGGKGRFGHQQKSTLAPLLAGAHLHSVLCSPEKTAALTLKPPDAQRKGPENPAGIVAPSTFLKEVQAGDKGER